MVNAELLSKGDVIVEGDTVRARTVASQIAIQKACEAHDLKKVFSFHRKVDSARDFTGDSSSSIKSHLLGYSAYHVNGEMPTTKREKLMQAFREADRAIMSNARCLTEGVDVPAVDLVAFLSPKKSKVDIVQAAGRAMRKPEGKEIGYILLPLFLETEENESIKEALARTDFEEAWDVLQALQEHDAVLEDIIRKMREERGRRGGFDDSRLRERVEVLGPEVFLDVLRAAISTAIVEHLGVTWDERYGQLQSYKDRFGDCDVPPRWAEDPQLGFWVSNQRAFHDRGLLPAARKAQLDALGFVWNMVEAEWERKIAELQAYKDIHGDCDVPDDFQENPPLGTWLSLQRRLQKSGHLRTDRKDRLDELGVDWDPLASRWENMFTELRRYKDNHGNCNVRRRWKENPLLASWVDVQRQNHRDGVLSAERKTRLDELGFDFDPHASAWEAMFAELLRYKEKHGHTNVPPGRAYKEHPHPELAGWVNKQRTAHAKGRLPADRKDRLDAVGFIWNVKDAAWETMFAELKLHKEQFGDCNITRAENPKLYNWMMQQKVQKKAGKLSEEREARLYALGVMWHARLARWETMFAELKLHKEQFGDCNVAREENPKLSRWVMLQRVLEKAGKLFATRRTRLSELGVVWILK